VSWQPARQSLLSRIVIAGLVVGVTAIAFSLGIGSPWPEGEAREAEEMNLREAVLRYQMRHNASSQRSGAKVYCLTIARLDPDDAFLRRFASHEVPVRKASDCNASERGVFDKATGAMGLELHAGTVTWFSGNEATVQGGYYEASLSASRNVYRLKKNGNGWAVVEDRLTVIA